MKSFKETAIMDIQNIFKENSLNPNHIDIGITNPSLAEYATSIILGRFTWIIREDFYLNNHNRKKEFCDKIKSFENELYQTLYDEYIDLIEGSTYQEMFEKSLRMSVHDCTVKITKYVRGLFKLN